MNNNKSSTIIDSPKITFGAYQLEHWCYIPFLYIAIYCEEVYLYTFFLSYSSTIILCPMVLVSKVLKSRITYVI